MCMYVYIPYTHKNSAFTFTSLDWSYREQGHMRFLFRQTSLCRRVYVDSRPFSIMVITDITAYFLFACQTANLIFRIFLAFNLKFQVITTYNHKIISFQDQSFKMHQTVVNLNEPYFHIFTVYIYFRYAPFPL